MAKQIDIFGDEVPLEEVPHVIPGRKKLKTMQEIYGTFEPFRCKTCRHCLQIHHNYKNYYKCDIWIVSNSEATDIRLSDIACKKYEQKKNDYYD